MERPKNRDEFRRELAEAFAGILSEKGLEWKKEWRGTGGGAPHNAITGANYRGYNAFWLSLIAMNKGYNDPRWVTMLQIMDNGNKYHPNEKWHLKKGSKATYVEYWMPVDNSTKKAITWEKYHEEINKNGRPESDFGLTSRYTAVFNAAEVEGMPELKKENEITDSSIQQDELIYILSEQMNVPIYLDGGDSAYYSPLKDEIHLPTPESFASEYAFNSTALHELAHSTGHPSRLDRNIISLFGTPDYAYEELVAEMCSCFMSVDLKAEMTPEHIENHKAYVQNWIQMVRDKPETLMKAIKDAENAAGYMELKKREIDINLSKTPNVQQLL